jgi:hypothetical protein
VFDLPIVKISDMDLPFDIAAHNSSSHPLLKENQLLQQMFGKA